MKKNINININFEFMNLSDRLGTNQTYAEPVDVHEKQNKKHRIEHKHQRYMHCMLICQVCTAHPHQSQWKDIKTRNKPRYGKQTEANIGNPFKNGFLLVGLKFKVKRTFGSFQKNITNIVQKKGDGGRFMATGGKGEKDEQDGNQMMSNQHNRVFAPTIHDHRSVERMQVETQLTHK